MSDTLFVRLVPVAERLGFTVRGHMYKGTRFVGGERPTWYEVDRAFALELSTLRQDESDPYSKQLFQVFDAAAKEHIEKNEMNKFLAMMGNSVMPAMPQAAPTMKVTPEGIVAMVPQVAPTPANQAESLALSPAAIQAGMAEPVAADAAGEAGGRAAALPPTRAPAREATPGAAFVPPPQPAMTPPPQPTLTAPPPPAEPAEPVIMTRDVQPRLRKKGQESDG